MQKVQLTYKFRLYTEREQEERLLETLELCGQTYNYFLAQWNGKEKNPSRLGPKRNGRKVGRLRFKDKG
jgi:transposase